MSSPRRATGERLLEALLWLGSILCAVLVLVPAASEYLEARRVEAADRRAEEALEPRIAEQERTLNWIVHDPLTDRRLSETPSGAARKEGTLDPESAPSRSAADRTPSVHHE